MVVFCATACLCFEAPSWGHTPESPEVQKLVASGAEFLRTAILKGVPQGQGQAGGVNFGLDGHDTSWGSQMLAAIVCYKISGLETDPVVEKTIARTRAAIAANAFGFGPEQSYECAISIIFLSEFKDRYRDDIQKVLNFLLSQQLNCGAWMYNANGKDGAGDTSVTQYAILAMWSANRAGVTVPSAAVVKACNWLVHSQHVSGQFFYLPAMPAASGRSQGGSLPKSSMTIAGVGSMYICADLLKMNLAKSKALESDDGLPKAFRLVNPPVAQAAGGFDESLRSLQKEVEAGIIDGEKVLATQFPFSDMQYLFYTYYSYERMMSLKDHVTKRNPPKEPDWYNKLVELARNSQNADGSWVKGGGRVADTAFMCLTLMRGMQKTIEKGKPSEGTLIGGRGLPGDTSKVSIKRGKVVSSEQVNSKEDILKVLESPDAMFLDDILEQTTGSLLDSTPENRAAQLAKLRTTLIEGDFAARRNAIKVVARDDRLDNAPLLIFALSDPDLEVVRGAEAGLRRITRRLTSVEIPDNASKQEREKMIATWKTWYKNLRPNAIFLK